MSVVELPWPDKRLSPNARQHWAVVTKVKKLARADAATLTLASVPLCVRQAIKQGDERIPLKVVFYPPDNRRRDDDNMVASFKAARDGIADALGVDDRRFRPHYFFEDAVKPGRVVVEIGRCGQKADNYSESTGKNGVTGGSA